MDKLKDTQPKVFGETIVWVIFVVANAISGLSLMGVINLSSNQAHAVGRITLSFAFLALFYGAYLAAKQRSK